MFDRLGALILAAAFLALPVVAQPVVKESPFWESDVKNGNLDPAAARIPDVPLVVDLEAKGRTYGTQGGTLRTMVTRSKDVRQMVVYGYARLVGYDENYQLKPDILRRKPRIQTLVQVIFGYQGIHVVNKRFRHQFCLRFGLGLGDAHLLKPASKLECIKRDGSHARTSCVSIILKSAG